MKNGLTQGPKEVLNSGFMCTLAFVSPPALPAPWNLRFNSIGVKLFFALASPGCESWAFIFSHQGSEPQRVDPLLWIVTMQYSNSMPNRRERR